MAKKKSSNKLLFILGGVVVLVVIVAIVGKQKGWVGKKQEIEVEIGTAGKATIVEKVSASGSVQPVVEVKLSSEVSGEIIQLEVEEGDSVNRGDFLLKVRPDNFESILERTKANLNQQKANLADAQARLARAEATYKRSQLEFDRQNKLYTEKVISSADFELSDANFKIALQDLESAKQSVEASKFIVASAQASVNEAAENLRLTRITAPMNGIVSKLSVELGETVLGTSQMQGTEILRIADLSNMEVRVDVNENDIIKISLGDTVIIDVDSYSYMDKEFKGVVTQIANTANEKASSDAVTEFEVRIKILNSSYADLVRDKGIRYPFRPGMTASVDVITETKKGVLTVPLSAVTTRKPGEGMNMEGGEENENPGPPPAETEVGLSQEVEEVVFKYVEGKAVKVIVKTGISDFDNIEILEGLAEGDKIITGPFLEVSKRLKDGDLVKEKEVNKDEEKPMEEN